MDTLKRVEALNPFGPNMSVTTIAPHSPRERQELEDYVAESVAQARKVVAPYWPIDTFIASNHLNGFEDLPFDTAMQQAQGLMGSTGFLPLVTYQALYQQGRINAADLQTAIKTKLHDRHQPTTFVLTGRIVDTVALYQSWLLEATPVHSAGREVRAALLHRLQNTNLLTYLAEKIGPEVLTAGEQVRDKKGHSVTEKVNRRMMRWCAAFMDEGHAVWQMPERELGFYNCWRKLAALEKTSRRMIEATDHPDSLPDSSVTALVLLLQKLQVPHAQIADYLTRHIAQLPGWASAIRWREEHADKSAYAINLTDYLAVRLFYENLLVAEAGGLPYKSAAQSVQIGASENFDRLASLLQELEVSPAVIETLHEETLRHLVELIVGASANAQAAIWQAAYEGHYRHDLLQQLKSGPTSPTTTSPDVQAIFCIDVRSEGFRRNLEKLGAYQTYGFAGFFGLPMLYQPLGSEAKEVLAPALINPSQVVCEIPQDGTTTEQVETYLKAQRERHGWGEVKHTLRENLFTPFAYVEMFGWLSFFPLVGKTLFPQGWRKAKQATAAKPVPTKPSLIDNEDVMASAAQAKAVGGMLRSIALTDNFAPLVLICGHGSETENNPYAAGLDCGACGGNHGGTSATVAASMLNSQSVRKVLAEQGINIPDSTFFLAGKHNTTTDRIDLLNAEAVPSNLQPSLAQFQAALATAGQANAAERARYLPGLTVSNEKAAQAVAKRANDWAQVRPEWGLVRNAAFICGRRELTSHLHLDNRTFLHSYDANTDEDGAILEGILTAPVVVAEMINMQYYLSSVDNAHFGSRTKLLHTVVSQIGVMQGRQSDLLVGLPQQSVMTGDSLYHEPMRLCVVVEAPTDRISAILAKHANLQALTANAWITLVAIDPSTRQIHQLTTGLDWQPVAM